LFLLEISLLLRVIDQLAEPTQACNMDIQSFANRGGVT
jgi:hypothetical protein